MKRFITVTIAMFIVLSLSVSAFALLEFDYYDEPVKVSFMGVDGSAVPYDSTIHDRRSATENVYIDGYKEYMNVEVERIVPEDGAALSALVNTGIAMKIVGHTDYKTTANIYTHVRDEMLKKATVNMGEVFGSRAQG